MRRIEIRGVICSPVFDTPETMPYIERGLLTPTSKTERELAGAKDAVLYVNSQGGDVFCGNSLLDAIRNHRGNLVIECGALVASEAANIVLQAGRETVCHSNTIFLFHSARSIAEGTPQALRDEARMLDLINEPIMEALRNHGVSAADVAEGFAEGREFLMSAREALRHGIVDRILENDDAETPSEIDGETLDYLAGIDEEFPFAAIAASALNLDMDNDEQKKVEEPAEEPEKTVPEAEDSDDLAGRVEELERRVAELETQVAELREEKAELETEVEKEKKEGEALRSQLKIEAQRHRTIVAGVMGASQGSTPADWREAVKSCGGDLKEAFRKYGALAKAYRDSVNK